MIVQKALTNCDRVMLAAPEFSPTDDSGSVGFSQYPIEFEPDEQLLCSLTYMMDNKNMSIFVLYRERHIFTAMCRWDSVAPYFAFAVKADTFIELYFER